MNFDHFKTFDKNEVFIRNELYTRTTGEILKYEKGNSQVISKSETFVKSDILWLNSENYFNRQSKKFKIFQECLSEIKSDLHLEHNKAIKQLNALIQFLLFKNEEKLTDRRISEILTVFLNDLNNIAPLWKIKLWIDGIWLNDEQIIVSSDFIIRRPQSSDLEHTQKTLLQEYTSKFENYSCIIEIFEKFENSLQINEYLGKLIQSLNLYNLGNISIKRREYIPNSILTSCLSPYTSSEFSTLKYEIKKDESENLKSFLDFMIEYFPEKNWQKKPPHVLNPIYIGIERYYEAIKNNSTIENKITTTITAFEALLLKANERSELSHKLSQRVSYLSRYFNDPPIRIYNTMKRAYEVRSTYIHGSMLPHNQRKDLQDVHVQIIKILRRTLLLFIDLSNKMTKDDLITKLDNSIIDPNAHTKLSQEINKLSLLNITAQNTGFLNR